MHALAGDGIEIHGQRGHQRLALARAHLGNLAVVEGHAANELHVEVAHLQCALACLTDHRKGLGQQVVECFARSMSLPESACLRCKCCIVNRLEL